MLREAAKLNADDEEIREKLLDVHFAAGDYAQAREYATTRRAVPDDRRGARGAGPGRRGARDAAPGGGAQSRTTPSWPRSSRSKFIARGDLATAAEYLTVETAGDDPALLLTVADMQLRGDTVEEGLAIVRRLLEEDPSRREQIALLGWSVAEQKPDAGFVVVELAADAAVAASRLAGRGRGAAGVRHPRAESHPGADAAGRDLRRRRPRGDDVQRAGAAGRRLHRGRRGDRGALHRRGSGRARAVGEGERRAVPPRARAARRAGSRRADRGAAERRVAVHEHRPVQRSRFDDAGPEPPRRSPRRSGEALARLLASAADAEEPTEEVGAASRCARKQRGAPFRAERRTPSISTASSATSTTPSPPAPRRVATTSRST